MQFNKDMKIKMGIIVSVVVVIILVAIAYIWKEINNHSRPQFKPGPTIVLLTKVKSDHWQKQLLSVGSVFANKGIMLKADFEGKILHIYVKSGEAVHQGQKLFEINPKTLKAELKQTQSALALSQLNYQRFEHLYQQGATTQEAYDQAKNKYIFDLAAVEKTKQLLDLAVVRAPFNGFFGLTTVHLGDVVQVGDALGYLQTKKGLYVQFSIPGAMIHSLQQGGKVYVYSPQLPNQKIIGYIDAIDSSIDPDTRMISARASLEDVTLTPGSYAEVVLLVGKPRNVMVLPQVAVVSSIDGDYVYKVVDGRAIKTFVTTGERRGNVVEILSGVKVGDTIVNGGQIKVIPGWPVTNKGAIT